jgi:hypothetical protein
VATLATFTQPSAWAWTNSTRAICTIAALAVPRAAAVMEARYASEPSGNAIIWQSHRCIFATRGTARYTCIRVCCPVKLDARRAVLVAADVGAVNAATNVAVTDAVQPKTSVDSNFSLGTPCRCDDSRFALLASISWAGAGRQTAGAMRRRPGTIRRATRLIDTRPDFKLPAVGAITTIKINALRILPTSGILLGLPLVYSPSFPCLIGVPVAVPAEYGTRSVSHAKT